MRIALFAAGGLIPLKTLQTLATDHEIAVVVRPPGRPTLRRRVARFLGRRDGLDQWLSTRNVPTIRARSGHDSKTLEGVRKTNADCLVIATFPWILTAPFITATPLAINLHTSILPRHRGADPYFWTYHAGDPMTGVTVHQVTVDVDGGAIAAQQEWPLVRGYDVRSLHADFASRGAQLLAETLSRVEQGTVRYVDQDPNRATHAPPPHRGRVYLDLEWTAEQTWHFLAGMCAQYREPLRCDDAPVKYNTVAGFETGTPMQSPGTVTRAGRGWHLHMKDGIVEILGEPA